jgi:hypothetical protein
MLLFTLTATYTDRIKYPPKVFAVPTNYRRVIRIPSLVDRNGRPTANGYIEVVYYDRVPVAGDGPRTTPGTYYEMARANHVGHHGDYINADLRWTDQHGNRRVRMVNGKLTR